MNTKRLRELAMLTQLQNQSQQPQLQQRELDDRARRSQIESTLGILGLLGQQQKMDEAAKNDAARLAVEQQRADTEAAHYKAMESAQGARDTSSRQGDVLNALIQSAGMNPEAAAMLPQYLASVDPTFGALMTQHKQGQTQEGIRKLQPTLGAVYGANKNNMGKLNSALSALQPTVPEDVWNGVDWNTLNAALPGPPPEKRDVPYMTGPSRGAFLLDGFNPSSAPATPDPESLMQPSVDYKQTASDIWSWLQRKFPAGSTYPTPK